MNDFNHDYELERSMHPENFEEVSDPEEGADYYTCDFCRGVIDVENDVCSLCGAVPMYL